MLFLMSGNNEFLGVGKSERLKELLTNPFAEENILWVTLIIWCTVEIILSLVSHTTILYKVGYGLWYALMYGFAPFWITNSVLNILSRLVET